MHQGQMPNMVSGFSTAALRAKASALFEAANRLSSSWSPRKCRHPACVPLADMVLRSAVLDDVYGQLPRARAHHFALRIDAAAAAPARCGAARGQAQARHGAQPRARSDDPAALPVHGERQHLAREVPALRARDDPRVEAHR